MKRELVHVIFLLAISEGCWATDRFLRPKVKTFQNKSTVAQLDIKHYANQTNVLLL